MSLARHRAHPIGQVRDLRLERGEAPAQLAEPTLEVADVHYCPTVIAPAETSANVPAVAETLEPDDEPEPAEDAPDEAEGDDAVHTPGDGNEEPPEPGAGLGEEVEETDPDDAA
jgi:hypothetical protein